MGFKMRLFCFPYAGGSTMIFRKWEEYIDKSIELYPIELSGRGKRYGSSLYETFEGIINDVYSQINSKLNDIPYAFYGHSLGSLIAYELAHKIEENHFPYPNHIFHAAHGSPLVKKGDFFWDIHNLNDDQLIEKISKLGGTPDEVLKHPQFAEVFLKILRSDFKALDDYDPTNKKLQCPITVLGGKKDLAIGNTELLAWRDLAGPGFQIYKLDGGHFFLQNNGKEVVDIINTTLLNK